MLAIACGPETYRPEGGANGTEASWVVIEPVLTADQWQAVAFVLDNGMSVSGDRPVETVVRVDGDVARQDAPLPPLSDEWIVGLVSRYDWPVDEALRVIQCESRGDPNAVNGTSYGLSQINYPYHLDKLERVTGLRDPALLFDPAVNTAVAYMIWSDGRTWEAWSCRP